MNEEKPLPKRKPTRLKGFDYSTAGAYFVTICTRDRKNYFWKNVGAIIDRPEDVSLSPVGIIVRDAILTISSVYPSIAVDQYVIMPNHLHLLLQICADEYGRPMVAPTISQVVKQLKGYASKQAGISLWQKSFHDHVIRNRQDYESIVKYIRENPMRWIFDTLYTKE